MNKTSSSSYQVRYAHTTQRETRVCPGCGTSIDTHVDRRVCGYDHADPNERDPRDDRHDEAMDRAKGER